eukprot:929359-Pelagomonas_calceolata.AAC.3
MSFTVDYSVEVPAPLDSAFKVLSAKEYIQDVLDLYGMLAWYSFRQEVSAHACSSTTYRSSHFLYRPRQTGERNGHQVFNFQFAERVPLLFGLMSTDVVLTGEQEVRRCACWRFLH